MKFSSLLIIIVLMSTSCIGRNTTTNSAVHSVVQNEINDDSKETNEKIVEVRGCITGDFNGDGTQETATLYYSAELRTDAEDKSDFYSYNHDNWIMLEDTCAMRYQNVCLSNLTNEGDLNGDGGDEVGFFKSGGYSSWGQYIVFTYSNSSWRELVSISHHNGFNPAPYQELVRRDPTDKNTLIVKEINIDDSTVLDVRVPIKQ